MVKISDTMLEDVYFDGKKLNDKPEKPLKHYEPLSYEVITFTEDVVMTSTFETQGTYDLGGGWFNSNKG